MTTITDIGTLIVRTPGICGGRPRIEDSRITVQNIIIDIRAGLTPEEILQNKTHLSLAKIYAALAYYYANKEEIDANIAAEEAAWEGIETEFSYL
ncbi:MAG: DUF433 domain-containing protein [Scytonema sp. PMC 1069.18]|nr:DUF433 domain-containing protein [Scytonema sp. PMC 1069.18]MEC4884970.1 DUF433 domain-containing protein [Scytonema sp. PMC 1070.18]